MTRFTDGPANGATLMLGRAPIFLRVVQGTETDALDLLDDEPKPEESVYVYVRVGKSGSVHLDGRDKKGKRFGRTYTTAEYKLFPVQPEDAIMRDKDKWHKWCEENLEEGLKVAI